MLVYFRRKLRKLSKKEEKKKMLKVKGKGKNFVKTEGG